MILLDMLTQWQDQSFARRRMASFVRSLDESDRVALYALKKNLIVLQDFAGVRNRQELAQSVEKLTLRLTGTNFRWIGALPRWCIWRE